MTLSLLRPSLGQGKPSGRLGPTDRAWRRRYHLTVILAVIVILTLLGGGVPARGAGSQELPTTTTIDFESFTGQAICGLCPVDPPLTVGAATFKGGLIVGPRTSNMPADDTVVYMSASYCADCPRYISIDFRVPVSDVSILVLSGTGPSSYTVESDTGLKDTHALVSNDESGAATFILPGADVSHVTIRETEPDDQWSFAIDNIAFNVAPPTSVDQCKRHDWSAYGLFNNQGSCVSFVRSRHQRAHAHG